jgi:hypothetical protein
MLRWFDRLAAALVLVIALPCEAQDSPRPSPPAAAPVSQHEAAPARQGAKPDGAKHGRRLLLKLDPATTAGLGTGGAAVPSAARGHGTPPATTPQGNGGQPFTLKMDKTWLFPPGSDPFREMRLAAWDSPMSRMELIWRQHGMYGPNPPGGYPSLLYPATMREEIGLDGKPHIVFMGAYGRDWKSLSPSEKAAAAAQSAIVLAAFFGLLNGL